MSAPRAGARPRTYGTDASAQTDTGERGGRLSGWLWHYRRELRPAPVLVGLWVAVLVGRVVAPDWGLAASALVAGAGWIAYACVGGPRAKRLTKLSVGPASLWTLLAWWAGPWDPMLLVPYLVGSAALLALWARGQAPRSPIVITGGSPFPVPWHWRWDAWQFEREARQVLTSVLEHWEHIARVCGVPGAELRKVVADIDQGYELHLLLVRGQLAKDVKADRLASALSEFPVHVETPNPARPREVVLVEAEEAPDQEQPDAAAAEEQPRAWEHPQPVDTEDERRERVLVAIRNSPVPISGRAAASLAGLQKDVGAAVVKALLDAGLVMRDASGRLVTVEREEAAG